MRNPWVRYDFHRCEMCNRRRFKTVEVGLYWVCNKKVCIDAATKQLDKDWEEWEAARISAIRANNQAV
jgi:ribosomal protein L37AE/L43A